MHRRVRFGSTSDLAVRRKDVDRLHSNHRRRFASPIYPITVAIVLTAMLIYMGSDARTSCRIARPAMVIGTARPVVFG